MFEKGGLVGALVAGSMFFAGAVSASTITLNPAAGNGSLDTVDPGTAAFNTTGGTLLLGSASSPSVLTIASNAGATTFGETGTIFIREFTFGASNTVVGAGAYSVYGTYSITGGGLWTGSVFTASPASLTFNMNLYAVTSTSSTLLLGSASLVSDPTNYAIALLGGLPNVNTSGSANTVLAAVLGFTPADAQLTGVDGFFQNPFEFNINVGAVGGNVGNTTYSVSNAGVVTVTTPTGNQSPSTGNFTFSEVPEPSMLSLAGIALLGVGLTSLRRRGAKTAA